MLFGEHAVVYGRPCLVTAVDSRMTVSIKKIRSKKIKIHAPQVGIVDYERNISDCLLTDKRIRFIQSAINVFSNKFSLGDGLDITAQNGFSCKYGLGVIFL